jgi:hypothetical protein
VALALKIKPVVAQPRLRCAWCHDRITASLARRCEGCNTLLHFDCATQSGGCVSPGCSQRVVPPTIRVRPRRRLQPRWAGLLVACATLTALLTGVAVFEQLERDHGARVVAAPSSPEMQALLRDVAQGHRGPEVIDEILVLVREEPHRAHAVSQFSLSELLGDEAVPALQSAWRRESDINARRWILGALGSCEARAVSALPEIMEGVESPDTREAALFVLLRVGYYADEFPPGTEHTLLQIERGPEPYTAYLAGQARLLPALGH